MTTGWIIVKMLQPTQIDIQFFNDLSAPWGECFCNNLIRNCT